MIIICWLITVLSLPQISVPSTPRIDPLDTYLAPRGEPK